MRLIEIMELKAMAKKLAVTNIQNISCRIKIIFAPETEITPQKILSIQKNRGKSLKFLPEGGIEIDLRGKPWNEVYRGLKVIMEEFGSVRLFVRFTPLEGQRSSNGINRK